MAGRRTNLALLALLAGAIASGVAMYAIGTGWARWPTLAHGAVGVAVVALAPWKSVIARRGVRRHPHQAAASLLLTVLVVVALASGYAHRAGLRHLGGGLLVQQVHVGAALAVVPLAVWHVTRRAVRPHRTDLSRRNLVRAGALGGGALAVTVALPHAGSGPARSLERGSGDPEAMPTTQWLDDEVPRIDLAAWRLTVAGERWSLADLDDIGDRITATLDCTGGWYAVQEWSGARLDRLLPAAGPGASVVVRSLTGYQRRFPRGDAAHLLIATRVAGRPLSTGHGAPARLVAPGRRGFWWVKWLDDVSLSGRPWWWQPPFPLT